MCSIETEIRNLHLRPINQVQAQHPILLQTIPIKQRLPTTPGRSLPNDLPIAEVTLRCARNNTEPGRVCRIRRQNGEESVRLGGRRDELSAFADDGRRASDVVDTWKNRGERERCPCPGVRDAPPIMIPRYCG